MRRKTVQKFKSLQAKLNTIPAKTWQTYQCTLVTPMYGGGVEAGKVDTTMPIRASSIRGQLRFWWRIACGPFNSPKEMFDKETEIWGGIGDKEAKASQVEIRISNVDFKGKIPAFKYVTDPDNRKKYVSKPASDSGYAYVLFSVQGKLIKARTELAKEAKEIADSGLTFDLNIHFKKEGKHTLTARQINEVKEAIRWWASFGGVGGRTRRGLGAVEVSDEKITPVTKGEVEAKGGKLTLVTIDENKNEQIQVTCWKYGCDKLRDFRQGVDLARNPPTKGSRSPAGQSRWPEADSIRNLSGDSYEEHKPKNPNLNLFPRAAFGLPIVFHFQKPQKLKKEDRNPEPKDHTVGVKGKDNERMSSPLILRPYLNKSGQWQAAALLLPKWEQALEVKLEIKNLSNLKQGKKNKYHHALAHWPSNQNQRQSLASQISPMKKKDGSLRADDPLSAFLDYFEKGQ